MRCPSCEKFASLEMSDPELVETTVTGDSISMEVRIVRTCADCGDELKEATLNLEIGFDPENEDCPKGDEESPEHNFELMGEPEVTAIEEGGSRYAKSYFGAEVSGEIQCTKCEEQIEFSASEKVAASEMEELA